jgi:hypothetical protein
VVSDDIDQDEDSQNVPREVSISGNDFKETLSLANALPKISKSNLPEFLPLEYLEDDDPSSTIITKIPTMTQKQIGKGKKTRFIDPNPKKPKDLIRGSTTYRVAEAKGDGLLAPKAANNARAIKEAWLRGRNGGKRGGGGGRERRAMNKGFLVKK